ncbi:MAG: hypothetical protein HY580_01200 [Nitrospinae bacterium]|nr:hypothetical protein [Nitrospinota bacterium]
MLTNENLALTRTQPDGNGGVQFLYRVKNYGVAACSRPKEDLSQINWEVDIIKFKDANTLSFDVCHTTELAGNTLTFHNDKSLNEFLKKAFDYFGELNILEGMMAE